MTIVYKRPDALKDVPTAYCPGCFHGLVQKLMAEVIDEMDIRERAVLSGGIGCNGMGIMHCNYDSFSSPHGRATAASSAFKRVNPDCIVLQYQGDGDAASIGMAETMAAANRGEPITVIFANNGLFGMTGGQNAPTTIHGAVTKLSPEGYSGYPMHLPEMIALLDAPDYVARCAVHSPKYIIQFKKALKHALTRQMEANAYSFIEVLCACPTGGGYKPSDAPQFMESTVLPVFPLGEFKKDGKLIRSE